MNNAVKFNKKGVGIPIEVQKQVFEAFEQVKNPETIKQSGFGLGLSIVAQLASIMNGTIELESDVNRGSRFTVVLPLKIPA